VLVGVSNAGQLDDNLKTLNNLYFSEEELMRIEHILTGK
jgi:aryl-alcohol dehydrogenase-like predicted oxidoreductase